MPRSEFLLVCSSCCLQSQNLCAMHVSELKSDPTWHRYCACERPDSNSGFCSKPHTHSMSHILCAGLEEAKHPKQGNAKVRSIYHSRHRHLYLLYSTAILMIMLELDLSFASSPLLFTHSAVMLMIMPELDLSFVSSLSLFKLRISAS